MITDDLFGEVCSATIRFFISCDVTGEGRFCYNGTIFLLQCLGKVSGEISSEVLCVSWVNLFCYNHIWFCF
jgi:hypothetical protein